MIRLKPNKINGNQFVQYAMGLYLSQWGLLYGTGIVLGLFLALINVNFLYVTFMLICVGSTLVMYYVYAYYGLVAESRYSVLEKEALIDDEGIKLVFRNEDEAEERPAVVEKLIKWNEVLELRPRKNALLVMLKGKKYLFIAFPYQAFESKDDLRQMVLLCRAKIGK